MEEAIRSATTTTSSAVTSAHMGSGEWHAWLNDNFPRIPTSFKDKYSQSIASQDIDSVETLRELLMDEEDYLESIGIKNKLYADSIKKHVLSGELLSSKSEGSASLVTPPTTDFKPVVMVGGYPIPITNLQRMLGLRTSRHLYSGDFNRKRVVVKLESSNGSADELSGEAQVYRALNRVDSHCCVLLEDFHQVKPSYLVLEAFGENMCSFLHRSCVVRIPIIEQLLLAVTALHSAGYVHGDLKPQNVLISMPQAGGLLLKLCDFDSTQLVGMPFPSTGGKLKYTPCWVSPEVWSGQPGVTKACFAIDVFAVGLIAAVVLDEGISADKTILVADDGSVANWSEHYNRQLTDEHFLHQHMPCQATPRYRNIVHHMCKLDPAQRATLASAGAEFNAGRATGLHDRVVHQAEEISSLKAETNFLRNEVVSRLDSILEGMRALSVCMREIVDKSEELRSLMRRVLQGNFDCPTLFVMLPESSTKWTSRLNPLNFVQDRYRLFFLCQQTLQYAPCGPDRKSGYVVTVPKEWVVKAAPFIKLGLSLLKQVLATYGLPLPIAELMNVLGGDASLHLDYVNRAVDQVAQVTIKVASGDAVQLRETITADKQSIDEAYVAIRSILQTGGHWDSVKVTCGLQQFEHRGQMAWILRTPEAEVAYRSAMDGNRVAVASSDSTPPPAGVKASSAVPPPPPSNGTTSTASATTTAPPTTSAEAHSRAIEYQQLGKDTHDVQKSREFRRQAIEMLKLAQELKAKEAPSSPPPPPPPSNVTASTTIGSTTSTASATSDAPPTTSAEARLRAVELQRLSKATSDKKEALQYKQHAFQMLKLANALTATETLKSPATVAAAAAAAASPAALAAAAAFTLVPPQLKSHWTCCRRDSLTSEGCARGHSGTLKKGLFTASWSCCGGKGSACAGCDWMHSGAFK